MVWLCEFQQQQALAAHQSQMDAQKFDRESQLEEHKFTRTADLEERKLGQQAQIDGEKLGFERERHGQQMQLETSKAENKFMIDAYGAEQQTAAPANGEGAAPAPRGRMNPLNDMLQVMQQAIEQQSTMFQAALQQIAQQNQQVLRAVTAPRRAVRDPASGRLSGVEIVMQ